MARKNTINLDTESSLQDGISFKWNGKEYDCVVLTDDLMDEISEIGEDDSLRVGEVLSQQLALFTGQEPEEFSEMTYQQKAAAVSFITEAMTDPLGNRKQRRARRR